MALKTNRFPKYITLLLAAHSALTASGWHFVQNGTSGVVALEPNIVSDTLTIFSDRATNDPLEVNGHPTWGSLYNLETNTASPLDPKTDSFRTSRGFLSNGTMVSVGGHIPVIPQVQDGRMGIRIWEPCDDPDDVGCSLFKNTDDSHLAETRRHPSNLRIFDGSLMVVGGMREATTFNNDDSINSIEFFPPKDGGVPRSSEFLARTLPANLFPKYVENFVILIMTFEWLIFMAINNQTVIYDVKISTETRLPDIPDDVRVTNSLDRTATHLPLHPPDYIPEILICGGTNTSDQIPAGELSSQTPASDQCSRMTLTPEGIQKGWQIERMLEPRIMPEMILLPNRNVVVINGAQTGYAAQGSVKDTVGNNSNADHLANQGMPTTDIARLCHSSVTLTQKINLMIAGSNPHDIHIPKHILNCRTQAICCEFRVEPLNSPYMSVERPQISNAPKKIAFNTKFHVDVSTPDHLKKDDIKVALMDLRFSSHTFHSSSRLVFVEAQLSKNGNTLTIISPPNNRVYPWTSPTDFVVGYIFLTVDDVTSPGVRVMIDNGASPPVEDQGVGI
ncbi:hypothetical protein AN958_10835 [Leucoagaricus sp. SymC.cos]|nr:hypothetical protein AN958_10835 [Leucoagaricus sp. SymC.cos]